MLTVTLASWLVADGDTVEKDQEVAEVDSDKATLSISAPESGVLKILHPAGEQVKVGEVIATIVTGIAGNKKAPVVAESKPAPSQEPQKEVVMSDSGEEKAGSLIFTPLAKAWMTSENLTEEDIARMLSGGKIKRSDLQQLKNRYAGMGTEAAEVPASGNAERREKMSPLRLKLSERLVGVKNQTAMLTTFNEVDMSEVMRLRSEFGKAFEAKHGAKLGLMAFFARAASVALQSFPAINAFIDSDEVVYHDFVDLSIAVSAPKGLVVPVVRHAHRRSLADMELEIRRLAEKARQNKITLEEMTGGTFTITNGGVFGSMLSTPILNPPQSAILGMHNIVERPVAVSGRVEIRPIMYVALSYDHRIIDGRESVSFLVKVKELIENPLRMVMPADPEALLFDL